MANVYTVTQVNAYIKNMFDSDFVLEHIRISGEISNCKYHPSGHIYFTLKDQTGTLAAVMFAGNRSGLKFRLEDGMKVVAAGNVSIYEAAGKYQLYVKQIEKMGQGELYERYLALKKELEEMGMFDVSYKQKIPAYAKKVGIVTAQTGAAIQDIINISTRRNPYVQLILYPAQVQGAGAAQSICNGIAALDRYGVDVMIVGRGGGSIEDLWAFNEECVARAIFACRTPVISAVGHETDYTIADFVADLRAPTPSAAAELAVFDRTHLKQQLKDTKQRMQNAFLGKVSLYRTRLKHYEAVIKAKSPEYMLAQKRQQLDEMHDRMQDRINSLLERYRHRLSLSCTKLHALSPLARLAGGYTFTTTKNGRLQSVKDVAVGETITVSAVDGRIQAAVTGIEMIERGNRSDDN